MYCCVKMFAVLLSCLQAWGLAWGYKSSLVPVEEKAVEAWHEGVSHHLGPCCLPLISPSEMNSLPHSPASWCNFSLHSQPKREILLFSEMEGTWSPAIWTDVPTEVMNAACLGVGAEDCQGCICHARTFIPWCCAMENIQCNVDENLWPDSQERTDWMLNSK